MSSYLFLLGTHKASFPQQELTASQRHDKPPSEAWPAPAWFVSGKLPHPGCGRNVTPVGESPGAGLTLPAFNSSFRLPPSHTLLNLSFLVCKVG